MFRRPARASRPRLAVLLALAVAACGSPAAPSAPDAPAAPDAPTGDLLAQLAALPGVTVSEGVPTHAPAGYRYFYLGLDQPVDHDHPEGQHFTQHLTLIVKDPAAPLVLFNTGYWNYYYDYPFELTKLLHGNQLVMEHRYFGDSRPSPADWSKLTIAQAAADQHHVVETFRGVLHGKWVSAGQSKGGMTSVYHHRFYPDDLAGTVAYVAPISFGAPDYNYDAWVNSTLGTQACRDAVKALAVEMMTNRRTAFETRAAAAAAASNGDIVYNRVKLQPAVESAIASLYWSFWQYYGVGYCNSLPATTGTDDALWTMLNGDAAGTSIWGGGVSSVDGSDDANLASFEAYDFQAAWQLGYPGTHDTYLDGLTKYGDADYAGAEPVGVTLEPYDAGVAMNDIAGWVHGGSASHLVWVYGGWDPWTGGQFDITGATDAVKVTVPEATHGALLTQLSAGDRATTFAMLEAWTGVAPDASAVANLRALAPRAPEVRPPPALLRAMQLRAP